MTNKYIPLSVLDLVPVLDGHSINEALNSSTKLAQAVEQFGYSRYWVAEHHNFIDIASAATSVVLSHIGAKTEKIRIGSGGIMLPNHRPLIVAEQFGTLESLYPNRVDLGIGRAPGTDFETAKALGRDLMSREDTFPKSLEELEFYFSNKSLDSRVKAVPGAGLDIPIYLLGSSTYSAQLAAKKGLAFAFASHFAPDSMYDAIKIYKQNFQPSEHLKEPHVIVCVNAVAADTKEEAQYLSTTELQKFLNLQHGKEQLLQKPIPVSEMNSLWTMQEERYIRNKTRESIWGTPEYVVERLNDLIERTGANEVMINSWIYNPQIRIYSYELISKAWFKEQN